ncbi:caprin-1 isoform X5 [Ambystoma mexicanum]|uniref:caprin-1 isoform X5 n=1 Tax=Ambystoma mexicanum TaxID=8296 RepID=UPI0037E7099C
MPSVTGSTKAAVPGSSEAAACSSLVQQPVLGQMPCGTVTIQTEAMKQILGVIDKKLRNLEKKKGKLDDYQERKNKGERLNQDQLDAVSKHQEVVSNMEFARELQRNFLSLSQDIQKSIKKAARREQLVREELEQKRLKTVLEIQFILDKLGDEEVRTDLKQGMNGVPVLSEEELAVLDEFYKLVEPERDPNRRLNEQYDQATIHLWDLLEAKEKPVCGTSYKPLREIIERIFQSGYFDRSNASHQNGLCEEEEVVPVTEEEPQEEVVVAAAAAAAEPEPEVVEEYAEPSEVESTEFVNRQFMTEAQFSSSCEKEQLEEWTVETVEDSMLEFENQNMDPAIVAAQPMNPSQSMDLPQMVCPPVHTESRLPQPNQIPVQPDSTQVALVSSTTEGYASSQAMYQPSHATDQRQQKDSIDQIQASLSLSADQTPVPSALPASTPPQVFQAGSTKPLHSSGINVNAAPFQSMQTVFNMNAPVPPASDPDNLKSQAQYQANYSQTFSSQPLQVEQSELQQESLQTVVGAYHSSPDQSHQVAGSHQQPQQQNTGFPRNSQPYYNSRGVARGGVRNPRGLMNGYRGPSNGFRGGYDGYRPSFSNTPNSGYTQSQFNAPRDYSNNYQRDGYQPNFKRGSGQGGPRGAPRGRGGPPRPTREMPQMNSQQVN